MAEPRPSALRVWLQESFTENVGLKLVSLVVALVLFGITRVRTGEPVQRTLEVSLLARLPSQGNRVLLSELPGRLRATVRGPAPVVARLRGDDLGPVQLDLSDGRALVDIERASLLLPAGVELVQVEPRRLALEWDTTVTRRVAVEVNFEGRPPSGLRAGTVTVSPSMIRVTGPSRAVDALTELRTLPFDLSTIAAPRVERRVRLEAPPARVLFEPAGLVTVSFEVEHELRDRRFDRLTVAALGPAAPRPLLRPTMVTVVLRGEPSALDALDSAQLVPVVDLRALPAGSGTVALPVALEHVPAGMSVLTIEPAEVVVQAVR